MGVEVEKVEDWGKLSTPEGEGSSYDRGGEGKESGICYIREGDI